MSYFYLVRGANGERPAEIYTHIPDLYRAGQIHLQL
jgi:hypothetical protein